MKKFLLLTSALGILIIIGAGCENAKPIVKQEITPASEGQACGLEISCEQGLKCLKNTCSSGKVNSSCETYKDCQSGLYCVKSICANPPSYTKYFSKIQISRMKPIPPGPDNIPVPSTTFKNTDAVEIDITGKPGISGVVTYDLIDSTTGETVLANTGDPNAKPHIIGNFGTGFMIPQNLSGNYDLNVYFNGELVYTNTIEITQ